MTLQPRLKTPDILKGIAALFMFQMHLTLLFLNSDAFSSMTGKISRFFGSTPVTPVFLVIMGYFLARSQKSFGEKIFRGLKILIWGFFLNIGLNLNLLINIYNGKFKLNPYDYIFGINVFFLAGSSIMIITILSLILKKNYIPYLLLATFTTIVTPYLPDLSQLSYHLKFIHAFLWGKQFWSYFPIFPWIAYPILGYAFSLFENNYLQMKKNKEWIGFVTVISGICLVLSSPYALKITYSMNLFYHHDLLFFIWTSLFLITWCSLIFLLTRIWGENILFKYFNWLGKNVTSFYVFQWLIIGNLATLFYKNLTIFETFPLLVTIMFFSNWLVLIWKRILLNFSS